MNFEGEKLNLLLRKGVFTIRLDGWIR